MTSEPPPSEYFTGIDFNPSFYQDTVRVKENFWPNYES